MWESASSRKAEVGTPIGYGTRRKTELISHSKELSQLDSSVMNFRLLGTSSVCLYVVSK